MSSVSLCARRNAHFAWPYLGPRGYSISVKGSRMPFASTNRQCECNWQCCILFVETWCRSRSASFYFFIHSFIHSLACSSPWLLIIGSVRNKWRQQHFACARFFIYSGKSIESTRDSNSSRRSSSPSSSSCFRTSWRRESLAVSVRSVVTSHLVGRITRSHNCTAPYFC